MKTIVVICSMLGLAVLPACSGKSKKRGGEVGAGNNSGSGGSASGGVAGTSSGGSGGTAGTGAGGTAGTSSGGGAAGSAGASSGGGAAGSAGASSGNGGAGGGDSGGGGAGGESSCGCVDEELSWNRHGGLAADRETSTLEPCHTFTLVRAPFMTDPVTLMCTDPIESCDGIVDPGDIQAALEHPEVVAAFADSPVLFGRDLRAADGQVLQIHRGAALIEIGPECTGAAGCTDEPPGVVTLRTLLESLTEQIKSREPCSDVF